MQLQFALKQVLGLAEPEHPVKAPDFEHFECIPVTVQKDQGLARGIRLFLQSEQRPDNGGIKKCNIGEIHANFLDLLIGKCLLVRAPDIFLQGIIDIARESDVRCTTVESNRDCHGDLLIDH